MLLARIKHRLSLTRAKRLVRRWAVRDRAWIGRIAARLGTVRVEECRFRIDSPLISDALKSRLLYGRYERTERELLRKHLNRSFPVVELGGGMGVVACIVNARLDDPRKHVVVEANARMLPLIEANRTLNSASFTLIHAAIAYGRSRVSIQTTSDLLASQTQPGSDGDVPAVHLAEILDRHLFDKCTLICDIEGAEIELVVHELDVLRSRVATIVVEEHPEYCSAEVRTGMFQRLEQGGFRRVDALRKVHVLVNATL